MKKLKSSLNGLNPLSGLSYVIITAIAILIFSGCGGPAKEASEDEEQEEAEIAMEEEIWLIEEHMYHDIALTSLAEAEMEAEEAEEAEEEAEKEAEAEAEAAAAAEAEAREEAEREREETIAEEEYIEEAVEEAYEIAQMEAFEEALIEAEYEALANTWVETDLVIPLDETETVVAYNKKGEETAAVQVVSDAATGEVKQITFMDKKHTDVYDVEAGMSGKEVKKLRRELKHMEKKGQVFLYDDQSNIMYLMDAENMVGDEITAADIETMEVTAIVWKDKKHHKKDK